MILIILIAGLTKGMDGFIDKDAVFVEAKDGRLKLKVRVAQ